ncbi:hypothetical protein B0T24DRAFT_602053 [Lasiosphaeria ovina]|uniref:Uncharacterized protein n=1 Tax=Lasiosphaeria ovina TaxID=92902 RepID=A0AAE0TWZ9_9PEZI|nr:hypothetical protein B0T24DRAFT_602053 [Lasiosphaeria ovina]
MSRYGELRRALLFYWHGLPILMAVPGFGMRIASSTCVVSADSMQLKVCVWWAGATEFKSLPYKKWSVSWAAARHL